LLLGGGNDELEKREVGVGKCMILLMGKKTSPSLLSYTTTSYKRCMIWMS
jgi:hypothetical protein